MKKFRFSLSYSVTDKIGVVLKVANVLAKHRASTIRTVEQVLDEDLFGGAIVAEIEEDRWEGLKREVRQSLKGFAVAMKRHAPRPPKVFRSTPETPYTVTVRTHDEIGVWLEATSVVAGQKISIHGSRSETFQAPMAGGHMYFMQFFVMLPDGADGTNLEEELIDRFGSVAWDVDVSRGWDDWKSPNEGRADEDSMPAAA